MKASFGISNLFFSVSRSQLDAQQVRLEKEASRAVGGRAVDSATVIRTQDMSLGALFLSLLGADTTIKQTFASPLDVPLDLWGSALRVETVVSDLKTGEVVGQGGILNNDSRQAAFQIGPQEPEEKEEPVRQAERPEAELAWRQEPEPPERIIKQAAQPEPPPDIVSTADPTSAFKITQPTIQTIQKEDTTMQRSKQQLSIATEAVSSVSPEMAHDHISSTTKEDIRPDWRLATHMQESQGRDDRSQDTGMGFGAAQLETISSRAAVMPDLETYEELPGLSGVFKFEVYYVASREAYFDAPTTSLWGVDAEPLSFEGAQAEAEAAQDSESAYAAPTLAA